MLSSVYHRLPSSLQPVAKRAYHRISGAPTDEELHEAFVADFFEFGEYEQYVHEFENGPVSDIRRQGMDQFEEMTGRDGFGVVGLNVGKDYYALVRKQKPDTVVETGVCNGVSTLCIFLALSENETGQLYSIDYPYRADEPLEEFHSKTFKQYGGAAIPSDKSPGLIVPDSLQNRWTLTIGKSQRELPRLLSDIGGIDMFVHDSEHSVPCLTFEYELAWEWLRGNGLVVSDDISWNDAFETFVSVREPNHWFISSNIGYLYK